MSYDLICVLLQTYLNDYISKRYFMLFRILLSFKKVNSNRAVLIPIAYLLLNRGELTVRYYERAKRAMNHVNNESIKTIIETY